MTALIMIRVRVTQTSGRAHPVGSLAPTELPGVVASAADDWTAGERIPKGIGAAGAGAATVHSQESQLLDFTADITVDPAAVPGITNDDGQSAMPFENYVQDVLRRTGDPDAEYSVTAVQIP